MVKLHDQIYHAQQKVNNTIIWYDDLGNLMKQFVPKEKLGRTNSKKNNPLSNRDLQSEYQLIAEASFATWFH